MSTPPPPPPPNDPFTEEPENLDSESLAQDSTPAVAASPGRVLIVLGGLGLVVVFLIYSIFFKAEEKPKEAPRNTLTVAKQPVEPPPLPDPEPIEAIVPPLASAPPPTFTPIDIPEPADVPLIKPEEDAAAQQRRAARLRSNIMLRDGGGAATGTQSQPDQGGQAIYAGDDPNNAFAQQATAATQAPKVTATRISNLRRTIAQGRLIPATTESAINTELPAPIRAIVSRDVYAEAGDEPLIPKGSRLIGAYNTSLLSGQSRVYVIWTRVIRPDGVDVMINSPLVDQIGQAGIGGQIDTKFQQVFSRAVMSSIMSIAFAIGSDEISGGSTTTTSSGDGSTTTGDAATTATVNALNRLGSTTDSFLQRFISVNPSILVDQGTPINVFVNRDLIFPVDASNMARIIQ